MDTIVPGDHFKQRLFIASLAAYDLLAVVGATVIAIILRFDYLRVDYLLIHRASAPLVLATYLLLFYSFHLYRNRWSFAGVEALWSVFISSLLATVLSSVWQMIIDGERMPRSVLVMTCLLSTALIGGQRVLLRLVARYNDRRHARKNDRKDMKRKRTVIMGVEHSVADVLTSLTNDRHGRYDVIGILDPDQRHHGTFLRGIKILGGWEMVYDLVRRHAVDEVIIAMHNGSGLQLREYVLACCRNKIAVRMVPVTAEWLENPSASRRQFRVDNIRAEDLLHRQIVEVATSEIGSYLTGKRVLVTGAGGSIGSELCRQIGLLNPALLVLLGHGENSIHETCIGLNRICPDLSSSMVPVICDIRDSARLNQITKHFRPQVIFHAAAHKHVPLMESNVAEAVKNNVAGTRNVIRASTVNGVDKMVLISTDKAVKPSSVMGATKFLCEEMARAESEKSKTSFVSVRFGNVLGSRGSVLPLFQEQIQHGDPLTVTHPEMCRYFMTIPEAVSLVLCAGYAGKSGDLFVLDMGQPVRIVSLAEDVIRLSGLVPYRDIQIEFCGLRPGEKLAEELFTESEQRQVSIHERLFVVSRPQYVNPWLLRKNIDELLSLAAQNSDNLVISKLAQIIPTIPVTESGIFGDVQVSQKIA